MQNLLWLLSSPAASKTRPEPLTHIASFCQYFPNKEALLFHITKIDWEKQLAQLSPILIRRGFDHAGNLRDFIREFFMIEAAEADLRRALRIASIDLKDTREFKELIWKGAQLTKGFIKHAVDIRDAENLDFNVNFIVLLVTSFAERTTENFQILTRSSRMLRCAIFQMRRQLRARCLPLLYNSKQLELRRPVSRWVACGYQKLQPSKTNCGSASTLRIECLLPALL